MIREGLLDFKLERTEEEITARSGLALYAEVLTALGVEELVERHLPAPGSNRGYSPYEFVQPLLLMQYAGGRHLEDLRELREDKALRRVVGLKQIPAACTVGDWLVRMGEGEGIAGLEEVNRAVTAKVLKEDDREEYTLDVDATVVEAEKQEAQWTYKQVKGYQPLLGFLVETPLCVAYEFREGNLNAGTGAVKFLERSKRGMPRGKRIARLRSDSAFYQSAVIEWCFGGDAQFTITADQDAAVKQAIADIPEIDWKKLRTSDGIQTDRQVACTVHTMNKGEHAFTLVVQRWRNPQMDLFEPQPWCYYAIATNMEEDAERIVWHHNGRGQVENYIKELKIGFGMEQMVSGDSAANACYFALGVLTYNMAYAQKMLFMPQGWLQKTIATLRWSLINIAGKVVRHGRRLMLKIAASVEKYRLFQHARRRCLKFT